MKRKKKDLKKIPAEINTGLVNPQTSPIPKVGQLFYVEYRLDNGSLDHASLCFIDEEPEKGRQWMFSQIAVIENIDGKIAPYGGFEAGGMPAKYTRIATDKDILMFINAIKDGPIAKYSPNFIEWLEEVEKDQLLLDEEKKRIKKLASGSQI